MHLMINFRGWLLRHFIMEIYLWPEFVATFSTRLSSCWTGRYLQVGRETFVPNWYLQKTNPGEHCNKPSLLLGTLGTLGTLFANLKIFLFCCRQEKSTSQVVFPIYTDALGEWTKPGSNITSEMLEFSRELPMMRYFGYAQLDIQPVYGAWLMFP